MRTLIELYKDHHIYVNCGVYSCPSLSLFGYSSITSLKGVITRTIKNRARITFPMAFRKESRK